MAIKVIKDFNIDLNSLAAAGAPRQFKISGSSGAIFSMIVKNAAGSYYNFKTKTFATAESQLKRKAIPNGGIYTDSIVFPAVGSPYLDQYDIWIFAESNHNTVHTGYKEIRFGDGSIDINSSTGSNSSVLKKVIYQYADVTVTLSALAPATLRGTTSFSSMSVSTDAITVGRGKTSGKRGFSVSTTVAATRAVQISRQPTINDLTAFTTAVFGDPVLISGEDIWAGIDGSNIRSTDTINNPSGGESSTVIMDTAVSSKMKVGDRVTGTGISSSSVVTVSSLSGTYTFVASETLNLTDGVTLTFTPPAYYRWDVASGSSIHKLVSGMTYVDADYPDIPLTTIGAYRDTTTYTTEIQNEDGSIEEVENTVLNVGVPALDPLGFKPTIAKGVVTNQLGNITFNKQLWKDVDDTNAKHFYAYGPSIIKKVHNTEIILTDLKVELTAPTTTTTEATTSHATIAVADREGVINDVSTVSGIGVDSSVASPTITSGGGADGAGDWVMSATQSLESGVTLTVGKTSRIATITGKIEFINVDDTSFTLYFDVEKFLSAS